MPSSRAARTAKRKQKDKWKNKLWYTLIAPGMFNHKILGTTPAESPDLVPDRVYEATMQELADDFTRMHVKLYFKVHQLRGLEAHTRFIGHELTTSYTRRLTRRKRSKVDGIFDVITRDGFRVRVKVFMISESRMKTSQQKAIRAQMHLAIKDTARENLFSQFVRDVLNEELSKAIFRNCKNIASIKRVEIRKTEVQRWGEIDEDLGPTLEEREESEAAAEAEAEAARLAAAEAEADMEEDLEAELDDLESRAEAAMEDLELDEPLDLDAEPEFDSELLAGKSADLDAELDALGGDDEPEVAAEPAVVEIEDEPEEEEPEEDEPEEDEDDDAELAAIDAELESIGGTLSVEESVKALTVMPGVGPGKAKKLIENGMTSLDALRDASDDDISAAVGPKLATAIREYLDEN